MPRAARASPLVREFLLSRLDHEFDVAQARELRRRAAGLLLEGGDIEAGLRLLHEHATADELVEAILEHARAWIAQGRNATVEAWIGRLSAGRVAANPWIGYWLAMRSCRAARRIGHLPSPRRDRPVQVTSEALCLAGSRMPCRTARRAPRAGPARRGRSPRARIASCSMTRSSPKSGALFAALSSARPLSAAGGVARALAPALADRGANRRAATSTARRRYIRVACDYGAASVSRRACGCSPIRRQWLPWLASPAGSSSCHGNTPYLAPPRECRGGPARRHENRFHSVTPSFTCSGGDAVAAHDTTRGPATHERAAEVPAAGPASTGRASLLRRVALPAARRGCRARAQASSALVDATASASMPLKRPRWCGDAGGEAIGDMRQRARIWRR